MAYKSPAGLKERNRLVGIILFEPDLKKHIEKQIVVEGEERRK